MTDIQILTIAIALATSFLAVFVGVLLNNARLGDLKDVISARIETRAAAQDLQDLRILVEKNHSEMLVKFAEMDSRLSRMESERKIVQ